MEKRDYLLREIEKIGLVLQMILNKFRGNGENLAVTIANQFEENSEILLNEIGFDMDKFLSLEKSEIETYISSIIGLKGPNIELLADILYEEGKILNSYKAKDYLTKALFLYQICNASDRTFSLERENKIAGIKTILDK
jgi:hypothetical protein